MMLRVFVLLLVFVLVPTVSVRADDVIPFSSGAKQAVLIDLTTGTTLYEKSADERMPTSSLSKLMTMYVVFEALRDGKLNKSDMVKVSEYAWRQEGSRMFLNVGDSVLVENLIRGVIIQSGNDASVALAEAVAGSEPDFAQRMNEKAAKLGMKNSHFMNATGLPHPEHYSTAHDLALLASALIHDFSEHYHYYSEKEFTFNNIKQGNRNPLLYRSMGVDGLKTGHTDAGGYGLIASANRDGRRLLMVINGLKNMQERADESAGLIEWGYREYGIAMPVKAQEKLADIPVWLGKEKVIAAVAASDVKLTLPRAKMAQVSRRVEPVAKIEAPVQTGQVLGQIIVSIPGQPDQSVPLLAAQAVERLGFFACLVAKIHHFFDKSAG